MENLPSKRNISHYFQISEPSDDALTKWLKSISFLSALIALLIFTDYFLPFQKENHELIGLKVRNGFSEIDYAVYQKLPAKSGEEEFWLILNGEEMAVSENILDKLTVGENIEFYKTTIFNINVKAKSENIEEEIIPFFNVYGYLIVIPIILLLFFFAMRIFAQKNEVVLSVGVLNIFLLVGFGVLLLFY
jgi:hypothetical protein